MLDWARLESLSLPDVSRRKARYDSLTEDLAFLGIEVPPLRSFSEPPDPVTIGCLYVLEGSVHGGGYLFDRIQASTAEIPIGACRFLEGFGQETKRMWTSFVQWMGALDQSSAFIGSARESAVETFELFIDSFSTPSPEM